MNVVRQTLHVGEYLKGVSVRQITEKIEFIERGFLYSMGGTGELHRSTPDEQGI